ncbi:hypothetical protein N7507_008865 [Penicillium longicatenatum]|nr:hypothetical protein N7507_008865 [Penicillium longicatenatum]
MALSAKINHGQGGVSTTAHPDTKASPSRISVLNSSFSDPRLLQIPQAGLAIHTVPQIWAQ